MGRFLNPNNSAFQTTLNSEIYVDKTGLLDYTNKVINTMNEFICNSRPRRFGKLITANMLTAYYNELTGFEQQSSDLLDATLDMDKEKVAEGIEKIHDEYASSIQYNNENSLSSVLTEEYEK